MSSSAKRKQKSRQGQSEDETKAENAKNAQRNREKRAAQNLEKKTPTEVSSMDESSSLGADDSGFAKKCCNMSFSIQHSSQQLSLGLLHALNLLRFSYSVMQLRGAFFSGCFDLSIEKRNFLLRSSSPDDDSQCGDDSSLQLNMGLMHTKNLFLSSCSMMHLRNTHLPAVSILSTETVMDFSFGNVDRHGSSTLRWIGSVASQSVYL